MGRASLPRKPGLLDGKGRRMTRTIFDLCRPRPDVASGRTKDQEFAADLVYPPKLYVTQRLTYGIAAGRTVWTQSQASDALQAVADWLEYGDAMLLAGDLAQPETARAKLLEVHQSKYTPRNGLDRARSCTC